MVRASTKEFPPFRLDTVNECLWRNRDDADERIRLTPKAFAVLRFLVEHAGRLVTEEELLAHVWPKVYVQPEAIKSQIHEIRKILGDDPKNPRFIETSARRGYQFIAAVADATARHVAVEVELPASRFVGRGPQLEALKSCLERSLANRRQIVFITGETGIGKTTLADECMRRTALEFSDIRIARGQCLEGHGSKEPYYPVLEAIGQLCRGSDRAKLVQILAAQAPTWLVQFPDLTSKEQRERFQQEILGATRDRMLREIGEALDTFSSEKPLLLVIEDLHWADPSTVDFISTLARRRGSGKLMLIGTYRPLDLMLAQHPLQPLKQDLLVHQLCAEIALEPLTQTEVAEYLAIETPGTAVPEGVAALIYRYSEGNPLFMVTAIDHLRRRGLIAVENATWQLKARLENIYLEAPESLRQMIELQIERLSAEEQRVLEIASVSGVAFTANVNALGTALDRETFESVCEDLSRRQLMVRRTVSNHFSGGMVSECYEFAHALYREVFYRRQTPARRAKLQLRIGGRATEALPLGV